MKYARRTDEEKKEIVARIDALMAGGMKLNPACKEVGCTDTSYKAWKTGEKFPSYRKTATDLVPARPKQLNLTNISTRLPPLEASPKEDTIKGDSDTLMVTVLQGKPTDVAQVLSKLFGGN